VPGATPVTTPPGDTVATAGALVAHVTVRPVRVLPLSSLVVALNVTLLRTWMVAVPGLTVTVATGTGTTATVAVPLLPSLLAVIVTVPGATPVTTPPGDTVATAGALVAHVTVRPVRVLPLASLVVALSVTLLCTQTVAVSGLTVTVATGTGVTVTVAVAVRPSIVAVMIAVPGARALTSPPSDTVAAFALELDHVTARPGSAAPPASRAVAVSWANCPTINASEVGVISTVATGTSVTVRVAASLLTSLVAVIVTTPGATAVARPDELTVATASLLLDQVVGRSVSAFWLSS
jgi:hypothetical protein